MAVVGAGIVGLATVRELILRHPTLSFILVEKEKELCELRFNTRDHKATCSTELKVLCVMLIRPLNKLLACGVHEHEG